VEAAIKNGTSVQELSSQDIGAGIIQPHTLNRTNSNKGNEIDSIESIALRSEKVEHAYIHTLSHEETKR